MHWLHWGNEMWTIVEKQDHKLKLTECYQRQLFQLFIYFHRVSGIWKIHDPISHVDKSCLTASHSAQSWSSKDNTLVAPLVAA